MKKQIFHLSSLALFVLMLTFAWSCKKDSSEPAKTAPAGVITSAATNISQTGATIAGTVGANGGSALTARGVVYSKTNTTPTTDADDAELASGTDVGSFSVTLTGLDANTKYYARAFATNSVGITYGSAINFTTSDVPANVPVVSSLGSVTSITQTSAEFGGNVTSDGGSPVTERGVCWNTTGSPTVSLSTKTTDGSGTGSFTSSITGLTGATTYKVRAYATNANGTAYGNEVSFTTSNIVVTIPVLGPTASATNITITSATSGGNITSDGNGTITARGVCWSTSPNPTISGSKTSDGTGTGSFSSNLSGLNGSSTYYVRSYATNSAGTGYGAQTSFSTVVLTVTDIDGNTYQTVGIGNQVWMKTNLKVSKYHNGNTIYSNLSSTDWSNTFNPAYAVTPEGIAYNWYTVEYANDWGLCPAGWHVPSNAEWTTLENYLNGANEAGGKMKSTTGWSSPNTAATNISGFSGLPDGVRNSSGNITGGKALGYWWSSTASGSGSSWSMELSANSGSSLRAVQNKANGYSIRCLKD